MRKILIAIVCAAILGMAGFFVYEWVMMGRNSDVVSIKKDNAKSLDIDIHFGAGELLVEGDAAEWFEGTTNTTKKRGYPSVTYKNKRDVGYVVIQQKNNVFTPFGKKRNNWNLQLTNEIPVDLDVQMGASESTLNLAGIRISHLSVDAGVGDTTINLGGDWKESFDAEINLGVGDAKIHVPQGTGVKLSVSKGIGSITTEGFTSLGGGVYVNEAYDQADTQINLSVNMGVGQVKFVLVE
ncbi:toast rack family protein [Sporosarcina sp. CAU 1771]